MTPRPPPENPDDDEQSDPLQVVDDAQNDLAPVNKSAEGERLSETQQPVKPTGSVEEEEELDRIEAYLRGPTAFTA